MENEGDRYFFTQAMYSSEPSTSILLGFKVLIFQGVLQVFKQIPGVAATACNVAGLLILCLNVCAMSKVTDVWM